MADDEEEDDYLSMSFGEATSVKETSLQRTARLKKEAAERGRVPSKKERAEEEQKARDAALATQLDSSNKGAKMMAKMGFKGGALGKSEDARTEPIELLMKHDRGGVGQDAEKKRKIREAAAEVEEHTKRQKVDEEEYRERTRREREERRAEGQMWGAMRVLETLESGGNDSEASKGADGDEQCTDSPMRSTKPQSLRNINILWRPLAKKRLEKERERHMRAELQANASLGTAYDGDEDDEEGSTLGKQMEELDEEDPDLAEFEALSTAERLEKLVKELREKHYYCFWCKYKYDDETMDGCPGLTEDEHG